MVAEDGKGLVMPASDCLLAFQILLHHHHHRVSSFAMYTFVHRVQCPAEAFGSLGAGVPYGCELGI